MFDDNEDDFCFVYYECVCEKGGWTITTTKKWSFVCLFVLVRVFSTLFDNSSSSVCVWEWVILSVIVVVLVRWRRGSHLSDQTRTCLIDQIPDRRGGRFFVCLLLFAVLLFFVRHFCFSLLVRLVWAGNLSPIFLFFIVLFFVFSRKNGVRFFVCFVLLSASFSYSSNQYLNY